MTEMTAAAVLREYPGPSVPLPAGVRSLAVRGEGGQWPPDRPLVLFFGWPDILEAHDEKRLEELLGPREKAWLRDAGYPERRRSLWLRGRLAAKEAVRLYLGDCGFGCPSPREIEIVADGTGRPMVGGAFQQEAVRPAVSISHAGMVGGAVAGRPQKNGGLGLDIEPEGRVLSSKLIHRVFSPAELEIVKQAPDDFQKHGYLRFWCAKEAAGKLAGTGLLGHIDRVRIEAADFENRLLFVGWDSSTSEPAVVDPAAVHTFVFHGIVAAVTIEGRFGQKREAFPG